MANRLFWSVTATACRPDLATAPTSSSTRTTLSISEYSVCSRKWTNSDIRRHHPIHHFTSRLKSHLDGAEGFAMQGRGLLAPQGCQMLRRAVSLVVGELEARITHIQLLHHGIAAGFREDGGGADGAQLGVPFNDRFDCAAEFQILDTRELVTIDLDVGW